MTPALRVSATGDVLRVLPDREELVWKNDVTAGYREVIRPRCRGMPWRADGRGRKRCLHDGVRDVPAAGSPGTRSLPFWLQ